MFRVVYPKAPIARYLKTIDEFPEGRSGLLLAYKALGVWYPVVMRQGDLGLMVPKKKLICLPEVRPPFKPEPYVPLSKMGETLGKKIAYWTGKDYASLPIPANMALVMDVGISAIEGFCSAVADFLKVTAYAPRRHPHKGYIRFSPVFSPEDIHRLGDYLGQAALCQAVRLLVFPFPECVPSASLISMLDRLMQASGRTVVVLEPQDWESPELESIRRAWRTARQSDTGSLDRMFSCGE